MERARVFLACPRYGQVEWEVAVAVMQASQGKHDVCVKPSSVSLLAYNFNRLWCEALNRREELNLTHFAMLHSDIGPEAWWLDTMIEEQQRMGVDVLSAIVPIKDRKGSTSTGILDIETGAVQRFSLQEVHDMPVSFTIADTSQPEKILAINTGLWVCDFTKPWVERICFHIHDHIQQRADGQWEACVLSEDWDFSAQLVKLGLKIGATRAVRLSHFGRAEYNNDCPWGEEAERKAA